MKKYYFIILLLPFVTAAMDLNMSQSDIDAFNAPRPQVRAKVARLRTTRMPDAPFIIPPSSPKRNRLKDSLCNLF
jgi:hypothetical protein